MKFSRRRFVNPSEHNRRKAHATSDPKFGLVSFPELVASAYFLWDLKDKNKQAAYLYKKLIPVLKQQALKYAWESILKEMQHTVWALINEAYTKDSYDVKEVCGDNPDINCLFKHGFVPIAKNLYVKLSDTNHVVFKHYPPKDDLSEITRWINTKNLGLSKTPRYKKFDFKSAIKFFKPINPLASLYGSRWCDIAKASYKLHKAKTPSAIIKAFDKLVHVHHATGNVFNKFDFGRELDTVISLKASNPDMLAKYLPKGPVKMLSQRKLTQTVARLVVTAAADPKFALISFPELVASAYFLWDVRDKSPTAASFFKKLLPVLKQETLKYVYDALTREIKSCLDNIAEEYETFDEADTDSAYIWHLHTVDVNFHSDVTDVYNIDYPKCEDLLAETYKHYDGSHESIQKLFPDIKSCLEFFNCVPDGSAYGGVGWRKIAETALALQNASPDKVMRLFDHIIHIQHHTGNVFNKFKFGPVLDKIIELKAKGDGSAYLGIFLPRGPVRFLWQRLFGSQIDVERKKKPFNLETAVVIVGILGDQYIRNYFKSHGFAINVKDCDGRDYRKCLAKANKLLNSRLKKLESYETAVKVIPKCIVDAALGTGWIRTTPGIIQVLTSRSLLRAFAPTDTPCYSNAMVDKLAKGAINTLSKYIGKDAADMMLHLFRIHLVRDREAFLLDHEYVVHSTESFD